MTPFSTPPRVTRANASPKGATLTHCAWPTPPRGSPNSTASIRRKHVCPPSYTTQLGVKDAEVREAICHHTTGAPGIGPLALTLYVADKIEPGRKESGVEGLRKVALKSLRRAAMAALEGSISHNEWCGRPTHPKSLKTLEWLKSDEGERLGEPKV